MTNLLFNFILLDDVSDDEGGDSLPSESEAEEERDEDDSNADEPMHLSDDDDQHIERHHEKVDDTEEETKQAAAAWEHPQENVPMPPGGKVKECRCDCRKFKTRDREGNGCIEQFSQEEQDEIR